MRKASSKINEVFRPKTRDEIIDSFCDAYEVEKPLTEENFLENLDKAIFKHRKEKTRGVNRQDYEIAANARDKEKTLLEYKDYFRMNKSIDWIIGLEEWEKEEFDEMV